MDHFMFLGNPFRSRVVHALILATVAVFTMIACSTRSVATPVATPTTELPTRTPSSTPSPSPTLTPTVTPSPSPIPTEPKPTNVSDPIPPTSHSNIELDAMGSLSDVIAGPGVEFTFNIQGEIFDLVEQILIQEAIRQIGLDPDNTKRFQHLLIGIGEGQNNRVVDTMTIKMPNFEGEPVPFTSLVVTTFPYLDVDMHGFGTDKGGGWFFQPVYVPLEVEDMGYGESPDSVSGGALIYDPGSGEITLTLLDEVGIWHRLEPQDHRSIRIHCDGFNLEDLDDEDRSQLSAQLQLFRITILAGIRLRNPGMMELEDISGPDSRIVIHQVDNNGETIRFLTFEQIQRGQRGQVENVIQYANINGSINPFGGTVETKPDLGVVVVHGGKITQVFNPESGFFQLPPPEVKIHEVADFGIVWESANGKLNINFSTNALNLFGVESASVDPVVLDNVHEFVVAEVNRVAEVRERKVIVDEHEEIKFGKGFSIYGVLDRIDHYVVTFDEYFAIQDELDVLGVEYVIEMRLFGRHYYDSLMFFDSNGVATTVARNLYLANPQNVGRRSDQQIMISEGPGSAYGILVANAGALTPMIFQQFASTTSPIYYDFGCTYSTSTYSFTNCSYPVIVRSPDDS